MFKKILSIFLIVCFAINIQAQETDSIKRIPKLYKTWMFYVPGITHFKEKRYAEGILLSTLEIGGIAMGIIFNKDLKAENNSTYYNFPLYIGLNALTVDKCDFFRNQLEFIKYQRPNFQYDPMTFKQLIVAPFMPKNIFTPITGSFIALALAELWLESRNAEFSYSKVNKMSFLNTYVDKNTGMAIYGAASMAMSWEAGVGEEYIFRNWLMPILDYRLGQRKGLVISSAVFGGMHAVNYLFVENPDPVAMLYQVGFTSIMGYVLGKNVQKNHYRIGKAIAAHAWYDFTLMLGSFLVNPKENVFGVNVTLKL